MPCTYAKVGVFSCHNISYVNLQDEEGDVTLSIEFWRDVSICFLLIFFAGVTSGLTTGFLSLDVGYLKTLKKSKKEGYQYAEMILPILKRHNLMLVTLLLAFSASLEALPIFLTKLVPNPYITLAISIPCVLFFVQLIPSSVCTRWALPIGYYLSWFVWGLMGLFFIVSWPISKILDIIFGRKKTYTQYENFKDMVESYMTDDQDQVYIEGDENTVTQTTPLLPDEVGILIGVLSMKEKTCADAMVGIDNVYMLEDKTVFSLNLMKEIIERGHSRIPVYHGKRHLIIGMFLSKQLICVNPKDEVSLNSLELVEIPHVTSEMPLLKLLNQLKSGKSQMAVVLDALDNLTPVGIITLENVIEELIGGEIFDETDFKKKKQKKMDDLTQKKRKSQSRRIRPNWSHHSPDGPFPEFFFPKYVRCSNVYQPKRWFWKYRIFNFACVSKGQDRE